MTKIISIVVVLVLIVVLVSSFNKSEPVKDVSKHTASTTPIKIEGDAKYTLNQTNSVVNWTGRKAVLKSWIDKGVISVKEGTMEFKDGKLVSNSFVFDMTSIKASSTGSGGGQDKLTTHLKSADFFDVEKYATSSFVAKDFTDSISASSTVDIKGDLTIKGITKEVVIPTVFHQNADGSIHAAGSVDIDRTLWDIRYGSGKFFKGLGDNVIDDMFNISFDINFVK
jgi:polyisoprenoid-binding protein YceI